MQQINFIYLAAALSLVIFVVHVQPRENVLVDCPRNCSCEMNDQYSVSVFCMDQGLFSLPKILPSNTTFVTFGNNSISRLTDNTFSSWPTTVTIIKLNNNRISNISENAFKTLSYLRNVDISHNNVKNISHVYLPLSVKKIQLTFNPTLNIDFGLCESHVLLKIIVSLDGKPIDACSEEYMEALYAVDGSVMLSPNESLSTYFPIPSSRDSENCIYARTRDTILKADCSNEHLTAAPQKLIRNTLNVDLSSNEIVVLNDMSFAEWPKSIETLNLSSNRIKEISNNAFITVDSLCELDLSSNEIVSISEILFPQSLLHLFLESNPLNSTDLAKSENWHVLEFRKCKQLKLFDVMAYLDHEANVEISMIYSESKLKIQVDCDYLDFSPELYNRSIAVSSLSATEKMDTNAACQNVSTDNEESNSDEPGSISMNGTFMLVFAIIVCAAFILGTCAGAFCYWYHFDRSEKNSTADSNKCKNKNSDFSSSQKLIHTRQQE